MIANFKDKMGGTGGGGKPVVTEELNVVENGIYNVPDGVDAYNPVNVDVPTSSTKLFDVSQINKYFVADYTYQTTFDKTGLDLSNCLRFSFYNYKATSLDISYLDTGNLQVFRVGDINKSSNLGLVDIDISGIDLSKVATINFYTLSNLETIKSDGLILPDIDLTSADSNNFNLTSATKLTVDSIVGLLNALPQSTNNYSFQIGTDNIAKLTEEQKAIATDKGWTLI